MTINNIHNTPGYSTRICPTAAVIIHHQNELYTILVKNQGSQKGYIFPGGKIEPKDQGSSLLGAKRELREETGVCSDLKHVGNIGTLHRQAGTQANNKAEILLLDMKPDQEKFLFIKQEIYELFTLEVDNITDLQDKMKNNKGDDIDDVIVVPLDQANEYVTVGSDYLMIKLLRQYLTPNTDITTQQIQGLKDQIAKYRNVIFS